ncbi:hypothetical protein GCM10017691_22560 [Pseudonocardia petroleophila]|uniref:Nuclear transport factor 2 family protein n=1 Tax=Pseudonocardia petroleophila TaxID=37331 RepID=A0A7G7MG76_9PSEU|nr:nuclear transport factor 2 family protein [Pseudonocardia petroleophila]QNG51787.1 nuclear transport factor 2 family protein [Pseudonocardia petroleophila]
MMTVITRAAAAAVLVLAASCSSTGTPAAPTGAEPTTAPAATASAGAPPEDRAAIEQVFADYNAALLARDFAASCALTAPEAVQQLIDAVAAQGARAGTCEEAFAAVYAVPEAAAPLDSAARTAEIQDVAVDGDTASVTFSGEANGRRVEGLVNRMQRIDGRWRLLGSS